MTTHYLELPFFNGTYEEILNKILERPYVPHYDAFLRAFQLVKTTKQTKVLILGQDPYPTPGHATGLAFSVNENVQPIPRSLRNIFRELVDDIGCPYPNNGNLTPWAKEGVLLLNTCLSTEPFKPNAHRGLGWEKLAEEVVMALSEDTNRRVFILWGKNAQEYAKFIDQDKHLIIASAHPSPLSANYGFFGSRPFSKANAFLKNPVNWSLVDQPIPPANKKKSRRLEEEDMINLDALYEGTTNDDYWSIARSTVAWDSR